MEQDTEFAANNSPFLSKGKKKYVLPSSYNKFHSKSNDIVQDVNFDLLTLIKKKINFPHI
jgi:hypothetical protein